MTEERPLSRRTVLAAAVTGMGVAAVGGDLAVEDEEVLSESVDGVSCRWCGTGAAVEILREP